MFNREWMNSCNPDLILRFWRYKGRPGELIIKKYGVTFRYVNTAFGELVQIFPATNVIDKSFIYNSEKCTIEDLR